MKRSSNFCLLLVIISTITLINGAPMERQHGEQSSKSIGGRGKTQATIVKTGDFENFFKVEQPKPKPAAARTPKRGKTVHVVDKYEFQSFVQKHTSREQSPPSPPNLELNQWNGGSLYGKDLNSHAQNYNQAGVQFSQVPSHSYSYTINEPASRIDYSLFAPLESSESPIPVHSESTSSLPESEVGVTATYRRGGGRGSGSVSGNKRRGRRGPQVPLPPPIAANPQDGLWGSHGVYQNGELHQYHYNHPNEGGES